MPRWPRGLHQVAGSLPALGGTSRRIPVPKQALYWRQQATELHAGAGGVTINRFQSTEALFQQLAATGPQGAGEKWDVDLVQVQVASQYATPPLVVQQIAAQQLGTVAQQPPPVVAQAWLRVGGVNTYLLAQSNNGGNDALSVSCPLLSPGEQIAVIWFGVTDQTWMSVRGTRYSLTAT